MVSGPALSLVDLETFDRYATAGGAERRFCCPLPGCEGKPIDREHRSLAVNMNTGAWTCHRCGEKGKIKERWENRPKLSAREKAIQHARRLSAAQTPVYRTPHDSAAPVKTSASMKRRDTGIELLIGSPAADYLQSRGIPLDLADDSRVRYCPKWDHWQEKGEGQWEKIGTDPRVVFPLWNQDGKRVAISARAIEPTFIEPKQQTNGDKKQGLFTTPGALETPALVITEAPIDALSLAACGLPAVAICGTSWPEWLPDWIGLRPVLLAFDNDEAGNKAAARLSDALVGAKCYRLRPTGKDWNDDLLALGAEALAEALLGVLQALNIQPAALVSTPDPILEPISNSVRDAEPDTPIYRNAVDTAAPPDPEDDQNLAQLLASAPDDPDRDEPTENIPVNLPPSTAAATQEMPAVAASEGRGSFPTLEDEEPGDIVELYPSDPHELIEFLAGCDCELSERVPGVLHYRWFGMPPEGERLLKRYKAPLLAALREEAGKCVIPLENGPDCVSVDPGANTTPSDDPSTNTEPKEGRGQIGPYEVLWIKGVPHCLPEGTQEQARASLDYIGEHNKAVAGWRGENRGGRREVPVKVAELEPMDLITG